MRDNEWHTLAGFYKSMDVGILKVKAVRLRYERLTCSVPRNLHNIFYSYNQNYKTYIAKGQLRSGSFEISEAVRGGFRVLLPAYLANQVECPQ
jgi:hypothetical protein